MVCSNSIGLFQTPKGFYICVHVGVKNRGYQCVVSSTNSVTITCVLQSFREQSKYLSLVCSVSSV